MIDSEFDINGIGGMSIQVTDETIESLKGAYFNIKLVDENDAVIKINDVDVINETFKRTNLDAENDYAFSIPFDSNELINYLDSQKIKLLISEQEILINEMHENVVSETQSVEYVKNAEFLNVVTREYDGSPFWKLVNQNPETDKHIYIHNNGTNSFSIRTVNDLIEIPSAGRFVIEYKSDTQTWQISESQNSYEQDSEIKLYLTDSSGNEIRQIFNCLFDGVIDLTQDSLEKIAKNQCFRIKIVDKEQIYFTNIFYFISCETDETIQLKYWCNENAFDFIAYSDEVRKGVVVRLPIILKNLQFPQSETIYKKLSGDRVVLSSTIDEERELETEYMSESWHRKIVVALAHDFTLFDGSRKIKSDKYTIKEPYYDDDCDERLRKAECKVQLNMTLRNANINS